jgi:hypothetical protein
MFTGIITLFGIFYLKASLILFISSLFLVVIIVKVNIHKRYGISIKLKNRTSIKKNVQLKSKNETVNFVNDVLRKIYNNKIENSSKLPLQHINNSSVKVRQKRLIIP